MNLTRLVASLTLKRLDDGRCGIVAYLWPWWRVKCIHEDSRQQRGVLRALHCTSQTLIGLDYFRQGLTNCCLDPVSPIALVVIQIIKAAQGMREGVPWFQNIFFGCWSTARTTSCGLITHLAAKGLPKEVRNKLHSRYKVVLYCNYWIYMPESKKRLDMDLALPISRIAWLLVRNWESSVENCRRCLATQGWTLATIRATIMCKIVYLN